MNAYEIPALDAGYQPPSGGFFMSTTMADEDTLAVTPVEGTTPETPVNDGIIDLDAQEEVKEESEDDSSEGDKAEEAKAAAAKAAEEAETEKKKLSGAQRHKLKEQRYQQELADRDRRIAELEAKTQAAKAGDGDDKPPKEEDYPGDWLAYDRALTAWTAERSALAKVEQRLKAHEETQQAQRRAASLREREMAFNERALELEEAIPDLSAVLNEAANNARTSGIKPFSAGLFEEISGSDKAVELSYRLLKNPDELEALNRISDPKELARAVGRLEERTQAPTAKKQTSAPPPLSRPKGGAAPHSQEAELQRYLKETYGDRRR